MNKIIFSIVLLVSPQVFAGSLEDSLQAALSSADQDHKSQQKVLDVHPDQVEKATFRQDREQIVVKVEHDPLRDISSVQEEEEEVQDFGQRIVEAPESNIIDDIAYATE